MKPVFALVLATCVTTLFAQQATLHNSLNRDGNLALNDMNFTLPSGWTLVQDAASEQTTILAIAKGDQYITLFAKPQSSATPLSAMYTSDVQATTASESYGPLTWQARDTSHAPKTRAGKTYYVHGFQTQFGGTSYYGFSRATTADQAKQAAKDLLSTMRIPLRDSRSITSASYTGHKYYFGWGMVGEGGIDEMANEVKYDVKHTNDIFTKDIGGGYLPMTLIEDQVTASAIKKNWKTISGKMTSDDMYVQYSSGHGYPGGLAAGVDYNDITTAVLGMKARELVVFTMACFSGGLVDAFNEKKSQWQNFQSQGRTLFVLASSGADEESSTGPGTDPGEPGGPDGSAGSAFGFALWKALIGEADGYVDGVKDGFVSLEEIRDYTTMRAQQVGNQTPVSTGAYNGALIMNKVPSKAFVEMLEKEGGTAGLTDAQVMERVQKLDAELAVQ